MPISLAPLRSPALVNNIFTNEWQKWFNQVSNNVNTAAITFGNAAPTVGSYKQGNIVFNTAAVAGGFVGWVCVATGEPGTWKTFGAISA